MNPSAIPWKQEPTAITGTITAAAMALPAATTAAPTTTPTVATDAPITVPTAATHAPTAIVIAATYAATAAATIKLSPNTPPTTPRAMAEFGPIARADGAAGRLRAAAARGCTEAPSTVAGAGHRAGPCMKHDHDDVLSTRPRGAPLTRPVGGWQ